MMNPFDAVQMFANNVKAQHGQNFNPQQTAQNMLGQNCSSPQEALQLMLRSGRITQQQYELYSKML